MDVSGIRGPAGLPPEKGSKSQGKVKGGGHRARGRADSISISSDSAKKAEQVDHYVQRLAAPDADREEHLAEVRARLEAGELDRPEVFHRTAAKILSGSDHSNPL